MCKEVAMFSLVRYFLYRTANYSAILVCVTFAFKFASKRTTASFLFLTSLFCGFHSSECCLGRNVS